MPLTILLADDSMTAQNMGKKILTEAGYSVVAVSNGAAAVKKIAEHKPDLAVLDVYMPGYTGLEVCERVKSAMETRQMPVLLTVGKMEPFKAEEGSRVKADGIIVKPFEASDLLAAVQKLEEKLNLKGTIAVTPGSPNDDIPEYERTIKIPAPVFDEQDESYQTWKTESPEHVDEETPAPAPLSVPTEMQASAAFAEELAQPPTGEAKRVTQELGAEEAITPTKPKSWFGGASAVPEHMVPAAAEEELETLEPVEHAGAGETVRLGPDALEEAAPPAAPEDAGATALPLSSASSRSTVELEPTAFAGVEPEPAAAPAEFEPTSAPAVSSEAEAASAPGFEPTSGWGESESVPELPRDPALMTDATEVAQTFTTKFGVEGAEPPAFGDASTMPELFGSPAEETAEAPEAAESVWRAQTAETPIPGTQVSPAAPKVVSDEEFGRHMAQAIGGGGGWKAEEAELEAHEQGVSLHEEMHQAAAEIVSEPASAAKVTWAHELPAMPAEQTQRAAAAREPAPAVPEVEEAAQGPAPAVIVPDNVPDHELAAAMAAAVSSQIAPAMTQAVEEAATGDRTMPMDQHTAMIAEIVHRVTERMKPDLVAEITRELAEEMKKTRF